MNSQDLKDLIDYIMKNNSWKECSSYFKNRKMPKYVDFKINFCLDTRDGEVWYIRFRGGGSKTERSFSIESKRDLEKVYKWLDESLGNRKV